MSDIEKVSADQLAFWNGPGGNIWVARQNHTDVVLKPVTEALLKLAAPRAGERVFDVGCGCGASTLEFARAVGPTGHVTALDISEPMLAEGRARAETAGLANISWQKDDASTATIDGFDLLVSNCGVMFFGDPVAAFRHMCDAANPGARMALVVWRPLTENPWLEVPMQAVAPHLPPRPKLTPHAPGMFAFADKQRVSQVLTDAGWASPRIDPFDFSMDIAADRGLEEAVVQSTQIGTVNSWLRNQPTEVIAAATASIREALVPYVDGMSVRLPGSMWLVSCVSE